MKVESIDIYLNEQDYPETFRKKIECLKYSGMSEDEAKNFIATNPIQLELYYTVGQGLWGVEAEAIEGGAIIHNPYTGEEGQLDENDEKLVFLNEPPVYQRAANHLWLAMEIIEEKGGFEQAYAACQNSGEMAQLRFLFERSKALIDAWGDEFDMWEEYNEIGK